MDMISLKRNLVLILLLVHTFTPVTSQILAETQTKKCHSSSLYKCCNAKKTSPFNTCKAKRCEDACNVFGCCDVDYNTAKDGNTSKTTSSTELKIIRSLCHNFIKHFNFSDIDSLSLKDYSYLRNSILPSYTSHQLLTVSLLC